MNFHTERFLTKETMVRERIISSDTALEDSDTPFVEITVCPSHLLAYKQDVLKSFGLDKVEYVKKGVYFPAIGNQYMDLRDMFTSVTYEIHEILSYMIIHTSDVNIPDLKIDFNGENFTQLLNITTKYWRTFGRCYSLRPENHVIKLKIRSIDFVSRMDFYVFFGYRGQFMNRYTKTKVRISTLCLYERKVGTFLYWM